MTVTGLPPTRVRHRYAPRTAPPGELDGRPWAYTTRVFQALRHSFRVRAFDRDTGLYLEEVYADLPFGDPDAPAYSLIDRGPGERGERRYAVYWDNERVELTSSMKRGLGLLMWHVNQSAVRSTVASYVVLHAAAAERDGVTVVLPAAMEAGKTTTVAGLLRAGFSYVTDEAVAVDPVSLEVLPFHKPLSVDAGSWSVLADLRPREPERVLSQWQVPPRSVAPVVGHVVPRLIVAPQYEAGAVTELLPVSRAEMLVHLAGCTFEFGADPARNLAVLSRVAAGAGCYRLVIGDLDRAVEQIQALTDDVR